MEVNKEKWNMQSEEIKQQICKLDKVRDLLYNLRADK